MEQVRIYKIICTETNESRKQRDYYSLQPWEGSPEKTDCFDDGGKEYILPDGYRVARDTDNAAHIYHDDSPCELSIHSSGRPQLKGEHDEGIILYQNEISMGAALLGRKGGKTKSEKKTTANREKGKYGYLGGRPRKNG